MVPGATGGTWEQSDVSLEATINDAIEQNITGAMADVRLQALLTGRMPRRELKGFFRHFIVTHLNSVQVLSFLNAVAPDEAAQLVRENLLEEMGLEEAERPHPDLLVDLARGLGSSDQEIIRLEAEAREARRRFASDHLAYPTLRELGLAILLETLTFEAFLSRVSDSIARSLQDHYGLANEVVRWFTLHGEVDVRHAEEGKRVVEYYIAFHRFDETEVEAIVRKTFPRNVVLARYFPGSPRPSRRSGIQAVDVYALRIPFQRAFAHARMDRGSSDAVVVRVTGKDGSHGYGEGLPRPYVTGEDVPGMVAALSGELAPLVVSRTFAPGAGVLPDLEALRDAWRQQQARTATVWNATYCAMELALLDWSFCRAGVPISSWLAPVRREVVYTGVIEATDPGAAAELARRYAAARFTSIKVKVGIGDDERRLEAVREAAGEGVALRVDANGAWSGAQAVRALRRLGRFGIEAVEQPVAAADVAGMRRVREESGLAVVADESLVTLEDARRLIDGRACDVFNVRVSKCGGLAASREIAELALESGLDVQVGAQVGETSLLSAVGRHLAAYLPRVRYVEGSFGTHLLREDIASDPVMFGPAGRADMVVGDGLGVQVDAAVLDRLTVDHVHVGR